MNRVVCTLLLCTILGCSKSQPVPKDLNLVDHFDTQTPLQWTNLTVEKLKAIPETSRPVLISMQDLSFTKTPYLQYYLECELDHEPNLEFRKFVHQNNVELIKLQFSYARVETRSEELAGLVFSILREQYPNPEDDDSLSSRFLIALPRKTRLIFFRQQFPDSKDVMAAILSNGETTDGERYFAGETDE